MTSQKLIVLNQNNQTIRQFLNHLNLPQTVTRGSEILSYLYDASGTKLKKTMGSTTTAYTANTVYKNGTLELIHTPEGYIEPVRGSCLKKP